MENGIDVSMFRGREGVIYQEVERMKRKYLAELNEGEAETLLGETARYGKLHGFVLNVQRLRAERKRGLERRL